MSPVDKSPTYVRRVGPTSSVTKQKTNSQQQSLALELPDVANDAPVPASRAERLWLCIHLPALVGAERRSCHRVGRLWDHSAV